MKRFFVPLAVLLCVSVPAQAREGFGFAKKSADMLARRPPALNVAATRANVIVSAERLSLGDDAQALRSNVEGLLTAGGMTLEDNAPLTVTINLDRLETERHEESKVVNESVKTKDSNGKTKYVDRPVTKYYTRVDSTLRGTFRITGRQGRMIDSGDIDDTFHDESDSAPTTQTVQDRLLRRAARRIAERIVPTTEKVNVLLPKGSFEAAIPLAEANNWDRYLAAVEAVPPKNDPGSEAFRQYALGVAKEGLAHATPDKARALALLQEASEHYQTAARDNPGERLFSEKYNSLFNSSDAPIARTAASITAYDAWVHGAPAKESGAIASESGDRSRVKGNKVMRNRNIIEMKKAGLADDNIIMAIESASSTEFDTTPDGLIALSKAGISNDVIKAMQRQQP